MKMRAESSGGRHRGGGGGGINADLSEGGSL